MQNEEQAAAQADTAQTTIANLDAQGVYWGVITLDQANPPPLVVEVPADCDLQPGKYSWSAEHQRFESLPDSQVLTKPSTISAEQALGALAAWAVTQGCDSPVVAQFAAQFRSSVDAIGGAR